MPDHDPTPPAGKPASPKPAPATTPGPGGGARPAPKAPPFVQVSLSAQQVRTCGLIAAGMLTAVLVLQVVGLLSAGEPNPEVLDGVRTTARSAAEAKKAVDALDVRLKDEPANLPPDLAAAVKEAKTKLAEFSKQLEDFGKVLGQTKDAAEDAKKAAKDAKGDAAAAKGDAKAATAAATAATTEAKAATTEAKAATTAAKAAEASAATANATAKAATESANKLAGEVKTLAEKQPKLADIVKAAEDATGKVVDHFTPMTAELARQGKATQETNKLLLELIQLNRPEAGRADLAVVVSHGEKVNAVRLLPAIERALDKNPARALFKGFRVAAAVEIEGLDPKPILLPLWPGPNEAQTFDSKLVPSLPAVNGRTSSPGKLDPAKVFPPPAAGEPTPRQCVFVTHPAYAPPPANDPRWKDVRVDAILVVPADALGKLHAEADGWAAFCRGHGGMAVLVPDSDLPVFGDTLRRLAAPGFPAPPTTAAPAPTPKPAGKS